MSTTTRPFCVDRMRVNEYKYRSAGIGGNRGERGESGEGGGRDRSGQESIVS